MDSGGEKLWWGETPRNCVETSFELLQSWLIYLSSCEMSEMPLDLICVLNKLKPRLICCVASELGKSTSKQCKASMAGRTGAGAEALCVREREAVQGDDGGAKRSWGRPNQGRDGGIRGRNGEIRPLATGIRRRRRKASAAVAGGGGGGTWAGGREG